MTRQTHQRAAKPNALARVRDHVATICAVFVPPFALAGLMVVLKECAEGLRRLR